MAITRLPLAAVTALVLAASLSALAFQASVLETIKGQVAGYVGGLIPKLTNLVAVETYEQRTTVVQKGELVPGANGVTTAGGSSRTLVWRLTSDLLLVRYQTTELDWIVFRDVAVVDGKPLGRPKDRLVALFADASGNAMQRAAVIAKESTQFQIPGGSFAATNPVLVIALMQAHYQPRLRFTLDAEDRVAGVRSRVLRFEELTERPRLPGESGARELWLPLLGDAGRMRGTVWLEPDTGRVLKTEARLGSGSNTATTTTTFAHDERLAFTVPVEMRTTWTYNGRPVNGIAKYGAFKQFDVRTEEQVGPPVER